MFARNVAVSVLLAFSVNAQVAGHGFKLQTVLNSAKCLTASSPANGAAVVIEDCGTNATSLNTWFATPLGPSGFSSALSAGGFSSCLDVTGGPSGVAADGTKLQMWACSAADGAQEFIFSEGSTIEWGGGIVVDGVKVCVDVTDGVTTNGNQLQIWECTGNNSNQKFNMIPV
ncbi:ricin B lectin domain-containing protein [Mycena vulgaris]|nr:ricin B lectin domain-containing protein [Mycena vulgaris]